MKPSLIPSEGIYYVVRLPTGWELKTYRYAENASLDHVHWWEQTLALEVSMAWAKRKGMASRELLQDVLPLTYAFPRGRVSKVKRTFLILHGEDLEPPMGVSPKDVEDAFGIAGKCKWLEDEHEHCQAMDAHCVRTLLGIKDHWDSVGR